MITVGINDLALGHTFDELPSHCSNLRVVNHEKICLGFAKSSTFFALQVPLHILPCTILDFGTGIGLTLLAVLSRAVRSLSVGVRFVSAVDGLPAMLDLAAGKFQDFHDVLLSAMAASFPSPLLFYGDIANLRMSAAPPEFS